ncbi:glycosyltransferase [Schleiferilactobacillus shenzhenensis]|uniref:Uncharacterized protein n=1 Tax=Schleiferilactobacillus shenzhenensis LY-73 TaxID=1231336 RepID=U4TI98_9LACO|nr:glycosyltransferase [Schleiferilactobacillus shenzhenensis]ERL64526.1 hypothetical protein L248_0821 [Schleiferilactobacillus shenzhenensis LY-73]
MSKNAVAFTVTGPHIQLTAAALASLCQTHRAPEHLDVLIVAAGLGSADIAAIRRLPQLFGRPNIFVTVWQPPAQVNQIHPVAASPRFPAMTFWRLLVPAYFPQFDRILYTDNDVLFCQDVSTLFPLLPDTEPVAAVPDFYYHALANMPQMAAHFGLATSRDYVNSGVILFNVARFNALFPPAAIIAAANANRDNYPDQAVLNRITAGHLVPLPLTVNYQKDDHWLNDWAKTAAPAHYPEFAAARQQVAIRHFVEFGTDSLPWQHIALRDPWEAQWWQTMNAVKERLQQDTE